LRAKTLDIYAPLANRLGVCSSNGNLEDLSFRYLEPSSTSAIAGMLEDRRSERERFIEQAIAELADELARAGIRAEITGRRSISTASTARCGRSRSTSSEIHDASGPARAGRGGQGLLRPCSASSHNLWAPIPREFDDYISRPKANL